MASECVCVCAADASSATELVAVGSSQRKVEARCNSLLRRRSPGHAQNTMQTRCDVKRRWVYSLGHMSNIASESTKMPKVPCGRPGGLAGHPTTL